ECLFLQITRIDCIVWRETRVWKNLILPISPGETITVQPLNGRFLTKWRIHNIEIVEFVHDLTMVNIVEDPGSVIKYHVENNKNAPPMSLCDEFCQFSLRTRWCPI